MVQIMVYSDANSANIPGMLTAVAEAAAHLMGGAYPLVSPLIGVLGTFFSGSCTVSSILFVTIQFDTAHLLGLPEAAIVALQLVGGGIGSMIRISGVDLPDSDFDFDCAFPARCMDFIFLKNLRRRKQIHSF